MQTAEDPAVWFPTIRTGTGTDVFTINLCDGLRKAGVRAEITWLPHRTEFAPWSIKKPSVPSWATMAHINSWFPSRLLPDNLPLVATVHHCVHSRECMTYKTWPQTVYHWTWIRKLERETLKKAVGISAVSHYTKAQTQAAFGNLAIDVIANTVGCTLEFGKTHAPSSVAPAPLRLVYVGSWSARKGSDLLPEIMIGLGPRFRLDCYGGRPRSCSGLPENMHVHGRLPNENAVCAVYASSDALLFPSRLEGYGLVIAEAQAAGLPVVASNASAIPEVVRHGVNGLLCDPDDVSAFITAIRDLAENSALRTRLSLNARLAASSRPDSVEWACLHLEHYKQYLARSR